jgi:SAM-dependent methyltransferase
MNEEYMFGLFSPLSVDEEFWDEGRADAHALIDHAKLAPGARVLVMPTGAGAHAVGLAEAGMDVTAVGPPGPALDIAIDRARDIGVKVDWAEAKPDEYEPEGDYDLILNLSSSVDFLTADEGGSPAIGRLSPHLTDDGVLVLRLVSLDASQRRVQPKNWRESNRGLLVCEELEYDWEIGWVRYRWLIVNEDGRRYEFHLGHQGYDSQWAIDGLKKSGFETIDLYGSLGGDPFEADTPLVIFARQ